MRILTLGIALILVGCATPGRASLYMGPTHRIVGPREITLACADGGVKDDLERAFRRAGFAVKRWELSASLTESAGGKSATIQASPTRYVLKASWSLDGLCGNGSPVFKWIRVDLYDTSINEIVISAIGKGTSDYCDPRHSKVFRDLVAVVSDDWTAPSPPAAAPSKTSI